MVFIKTVVDGKYVVAALVDTTSRFSTISEEFFDKLQRKHGLRVWSRVGRVSKLVKRHNKDAVGEISDLCLRFINKGNYLTVDSVEDTNFIIVKSSKYPLVLGQSWLKEHEVEISIKWDKISMDGINISIIYEEALHSKEIYKVDNSEDPYMLGIYEKETLSVGDCPRAQSSESSESSESSGDEFSILKKKGENNEK
ncbi:unnamed protein product [Rhizophagus irregularis]|nr:unnamed protein product [Rhizophagus irregularis]CAB5328469.1 unnamed protein product [Rhizophagus irregularis]